MRFPFQNLLGHLVCRPFLKEIKMFLFFFCIVAKKYMDTVDRNIYFEDVKLQCDAKLWGEEYNRHNPPKKVDIFMMAVLEMVERSGRDLYHVEHYIDGT